MVTLKYIFASFFASVFKFLLKYWTACNHKQTEKHLNLGVKDECFKLLYLREAFKSVTEISLLGKKSPRRNTKFEEIRNQWNAWNVYILSFSGPYFIVFGLNTERYFSPNAGKYGLEKLRMTWQLKVFKHFADNVGQFAEEALESVVNNHTDMTELTLNATCWNDSERNWQLVKFTSTF